MIASLTDAGPIRWPISTVKVRKSLLDCSAPDQNKCRNITKKIWLGTHYAGKEIIFTKKHLNINLEDEKHQKLDTTQQQLNQTFLNLRRQKCWKSISADKGQLSCYVECGNGLLKSPINRTNTPFQKNQSLIIPCSIFPILKEGYQLFKCFGSLNYQILQFRLLLHTFGMTTFHEFFF